MAIPPNVKYEGKFLKAYREAREGKKGVVGTEQQEVNIAKYSVYFFCDECCQAHPLGITIELNDGPPDQASIRDTYTGRELPPQVATLIGNMTQCPNTRKMTSQEDNNQVFLVSIG
ncbi:MAG: hypothetical protein KKH04_09090 [Proteobacteria bacterium]|nr:hypothetical protein [Pseudomonadota bacterium]